MNRERNIEKVRELRVLEALEGEPGVRQADLAVRLGIAVGAVNWLIKRLVAKGYIKVKRVSRWRWQYLLTPQGMAAKAKLTAEYLRASMGLYRETRYRTGQLLDELRKKGYSEVYLEGDAGNDLVDICRLTCLEWGVRVVSDRSEGETIPTLRVAGTKLQLEWPEAQEGN